jgi:uncharacterized protein YqgV (UPF0045/DUF77 family)
MKVQAEISIYPLKTRDPTPIICEFIALLHSSSVKIEQGSMSTRVWGEYDDVTTAINAAYNEILKKHTAVLSVTYNPCSIIE